ncbi:hypothetical protein FF100_22030 [Methylobacterium terricola]|uniref:Holin of 3TMs, for gene-transfer release n=1 Tax=Methylobacterium terricola TaxID=2583531 RepID=A0A5C4LCB3_9HYPH|nr:3TM-type holin [Methylobacterium terricola]TNC10832.1 hypothetical protein FF100_22030 [Methylobacterium terricola]
MGALLALLPSLIPLIQKFIPDPKAAADAQAELIKTLSEADSARYEAMSKVMAADAASESWLTANMRPLICLGLVTSFGFTILASAFDALAGTHVAQSVTQAMAQFPQPYLDAMLTLVGGYGVARTAEKITSTMKK